MRTWNQNYRSSFENRKKKKRTIVIDNNALKN